MQTVGARIFGKV